jgi:hypothetical protein
LQPGDVAAFESQLRQLLASSTNSPPNSSGALQAIPATLVDDTALKAAALGPAPAAVPAVAAPGFAPAAPAAVAAIPALGAADCGSKVWLVGSGAMGADVDLVMQLHDKLGALLMHPQVRTEQVHRTAVDQRNGWVMLMQGIQRPAPAYAWDVSAQLEVCLWGRACC